MKKKQQKRAKKMAKKEIFHENHLNIRVSNEVLRKIEGLIKVFPEDYTTPSDVLRAGVYALHRWKYKYEGKDDTRSR